MNCKNLIIGVLVSFVMLSCDCWVLVDGKVIDSNSKKPIKRAWVEFTNVKCKRQISSTVATEMFNCIFESDSTGMFFMKSDSYGICPDDPIKIKIRKPGYKTKILELNAGHLITELIVELDKE